MNKFLKWTLLFLFVAVFVSMSSFVLFYGHPFIAALILLFMAGTLFIFLKKSAYPLRFMYPGLVTFVFFLFLPIIFTVTIGFTNLGTGHVLTKDQVTDILKSEVYIPTDGSAVYMEYSVSQNSEDAYSLWIEDEANDKIYTADFKVGDEAINAEIATTPVPENILAKGKTFMLYRKIKDAKITLPSGNVMSFTGPKQLVNTMPRFQFEGAKVIDLQNNKECVANDEIGAYECGEEVLNPGYYVNVGFKNFTRLVTDPSIKESFSAIFIWTMIWALGSVFLSFSLGIFLAIVVNNKDLRCKALYRVLLIIPYSIPFFISILVFRGLMNKDFGIINDILVGWGFEKVNWLGDPLIAKVSCLLVNLWLGFPYMFLLSTGILQAIPESVYEAAAIDGAGRWQTFRHITLPMCFSAVAPMLVGSFAFNLNNFTGIYLLTGGGPPFAGATTPAGHTDILISYTYRLAFEGGSGQDFGLASAIAIIIFFLIAILTLINFKMSGMLKSDER